MSDCGELPATLAQPIERRHVLRALGLVGAAAALGSCKHLMGGAGVSTTPVERGGREGGGAGGGGAGAGY